MKIKQLNFYFSISDRGETLPYIRVPEGRRFIYKIVKRSKLLQIIPNALYCNICVFQLFVSIEHSTARYIAIIKGIIKGIVCYHLGSKGVIPNK